MITYNDLYETLRKEKYSEQLQPLPQKFITDFSEYIKDKTLLQAEQKDIFSNSKTKTKKQFENAISLFKELILRRKKKILNLVFVATETGIMKRDYENMLPLEKETFDSLTKIFEAYDQTVTRMLNGDTKKEKKHNNKISNYPKDSEDSERF